MMNYFKNEKNQIFAYDDEQTEQSYGSDLTPITELELLELQKPTPEQQLEIDKQALKQERDTALSALTHTFTDGAIVQVRPGDISNFQLAISMGQAEDWVMGDDTVRLLTVAEMVEARDSGIVQGKVIWNEYTAALKAL